jgi:hypothetical protein
MRRTTAAVIVAKHTVRDLGIEGKDTLEMAEETDI